MLSSRLLFRAVHFWPDSGEGIARYTGESTREVMIMTRTLCNIFYGIVFLTIAIVPIGFVVYFKFNGEQGNEKDDIQYYQQKTLSLISKCDDLHQKLAGYIDKIKEENRKQATKNSHRLEYFTNPSFSTYGCTGMATYYKGALPEFDRARESYVRNFEQVISNIDKNHDHKLSEQEIAALEEDFQALTRKYGELYIVYEKTLETWMRGRVETLESDYSRRHIYWVYQLALRLSSLSLSLPYPTFDVPTAEAQIDQLELLLEQMNTAMQDDKSWPDKDMISEWANEIPAFLKAAKVRVEFEKSKGTTATEEEKEASVRAFLDDAMPVLPPDLQDYFMVRQSS